MDIVIFGTGGSGRAIYRTFKNTHKIIAFIDSNIALKDTHYDGADVKYINEIKNIEFDKIAISGVWVDDMCNQLIELGVSQDKIWIVDDTELVFSDENRVETTDVLVKEFAKLMAEANIDYFIEGSSLLCLLRGQNLSDVSDVDVLITSKADIEKIWNILNDSKIFKEHQLLKIIYSNDKILTKSGEIDKIIVKSNTVSIDSEPTNLDINLASDIGKYYILDYEEESYHYYSKEFVGSGRYIDYKGTKLQIPEFAEKYVEQAYGENWMIPAKKWSYLDYKNLLLSNGELLEFMKNAN